MRWICLSCLSYTESTHKDYICLYMPRAHKPLSLFTKGTGHMETHFCVQCVFCDAPLLRREIQRVAPVRKFGPHQNERVSYSPPPACPMYCKTAEINNSLALIYSGEIN
eukprot:GEMP01145533.1.p1 GENE.GEMP01145533.1~~GEMP01145533.1.p1  ORF type:complete len:109 (+),score=3.98 GEMP01145533.1:91-417(+)